MDINNSLEKKDISDLVKSLISEDAHDDFSSLKNQQKDILNEIFFID